VTYTYDSLQRLIGAVTTDSPTVPQWGQAFTYDGFGNRTSASVTKGSAPYGNWSYDAATNRMAGFYDANGNMTFAPSGYGDYRYDVENRLVSVPAYNPGTPYQTELYAYAPNNKRIWKRMSDGTEELYFYGISGQKLGTYKPFIYNNGSFAISTIDTNLYFGSRTIVSRGVTVIPDRLGSNRAGGLRYFPYGEEQPTATAQDRDKFATYYRDGTTGLDYAQNRYYASTLARFTSPDPSGDSWDVGNPQSWNSYAYVLNDPINYNDPSGLTECGDLDVTGGTVREYVNANSDAGKLTRFVWAEGGTLAANGGDQGALNVSQALIAQAIENRLAIANGQVAVAGKDGNIYWGPGGIFNGVTTLRASLLGYGSIGTTLTDELVRAAGGTSELNRNGELRDRSGLNSSLSENQGDPTRNISGRVPVTLTNGSTWYVTAEYDRVISAMQATNAILGGASLNASGFFVTSWKQAGHGNTNPDPSRLYGLGTVGGTMFYGFGAYAPVTFVPAPRPTPHRQPFL